jgi:beta-lactamase class A
MSLGDLCAAAVEQSDNTAGNLILQAIGGPAGLTAFSRTLGDKDTRLDRMEPELNSATADDERDTTTPAAMQRDLELLLTGEVLSPTSRHRLNDWLEKNETGAEMIRAAVPNGWRVGDKTGRSGGGATNDIAVIRPPGGSPIFVAIYSTNSSPSPEIRAATIAEVTRLVLKSLRAN